MASRGRPAKLGREPLFATYAPEGSSGLRRALDHLLGTRVEGIVFYPPNSLPIDDAGPRGGPRRVPTVLVNLGVDGLDLPLVASDDADGVRQAVEHLVSLGHRRIAHLAGPSWVSTGVVRLRAFGEAMAARGLKLSTQSVAHYAFEYDQAIAGAQALFKARPLPTAVIAADDKRRGGGADSGEACRNAGPR